MNAVALQQPAPIWADHVWFARRSTARVHSPVVDYFTAVEKAAEKIAGGATPPASIMQGADALCASGELSGMMTRHGSDKGSGRHNYTGFYEILLGQLRGDVSRIFEMGIGSNNPALPYNMGADGVPGASLRAWREYFPQASIYGADIDRDTLFTEERIVTGWADQFDATSLDAVFDAFGGSFDLIVDDAVHRFAANKTFFQCAFERLNSGGYFVIEDVLLEEREPYRGLLDGYDAAIVEIPTRQNSLDNCLAVIVK